jgi:Leucine-rich repeat (LRR) protein
LVSALRGFRSLMALHLHGNQLAALDPLSFLNLPALSLLNLAGNRLHTVHRQAFLNVPTLRYLYLSGNQLTHLFPHQFRCFFNDFNFFMLLTFYLIFFNVFIFN